MSDQIKLEIVVEARRALADLTALRVSTDGLKNAATGLVGAFAGAGGLAYGLLQGAAAAERQQHALAQLGTAYAQVQAATSGTVTALDALRARQTLMQSGMRVSGEELATLTRRAREYALATGTETTQAVDQLVDALKGGEAEGLRRFGISVRQGETDTRLFHRALREMGDQFRRDAPSARTLGEELSLLNRNTTGLAGSFAALVSAGLGLGGVLQELNHQLLSIREVADMMSNRDARNAEGTRRLNTADAFNARARMGASRFGGLGVRPDQLSGADLTWASGQLQGGFTRESWGAFRAELQRRAAGTRGLNNSPDAERARATAAGEPLGGERAGRVVGSTSSGGESLEERIRKVIDQARQATEALRTMEDAARDALSARSERGSGAVQGSGDFDDFLAGLAGAPTAAERAQARRGGNDRWRRLQELERGAVGARFDAQGRDREDVGSMLERSMEQLAPTAARTQTVAENLADTVTGSFNKMANAAGGFFDALMSGEDAGVAFQKMIHGLLKSIAVEATIKALLAGAEGVFRIARSYGGDPTGYTLLANAGMWAGVAVATGVGAALTAPRPSAATGAGAGASLGSGPREGARVRGGAANDNAGGGGNTTIVISGDVFAGPAFQDWLHKQQRQAGRRGLQAA